MTKYEYQQIKNGLSGLTCSPHPDMVIPSTTCPTKVKLIPVKFKEPDRVDGLRMEIRELRKEIQRLRDVIDSMRRCPMLPHPYRPFDPWRVYNPNFQVDSSY